MRRDLAPRMMTPDLLSNPMPFGMPPEFGGPAPQAGTAVNGRFVVNVLRRWWKLSIVIGILLAISAGLVAYFTHMPVYRAIAWLRIRDNYVLFRQERDNQTFINTQRELIKSPPILNEAYLKPGITRLRIFDGIDEVPRWLADNIVAKPVNGSELFIISLDSRYQDDVHMVVNAVKEAYLSHLTTSIWKENDQLLKALEEERNKRSTDIEDARNRLKVLKFELDAKGNSGSFDPSKEQMLPSWVDELHLQVQKKEVEYLMAEAQDRATRAVLQNPDDIPIDPKRLEEAVEGRPEIRRLQEQLLLAMDKAARRNSVVKEGSPVAKNFGQSSKEVANLQEQLASKKKELLPKVEEEVRTSIRAEYESNVDNNRRALEAQKRAIDQLKEQLKQARESAQSTGQSAISYQFLDEDLKTKLIVYQRIVDRIEEIRTESRRNSPVLELTAATRPVEPIGRGPLTQGLIFATVAFFLPFVGFFLWELKSRRIGDIDDFREVTSLRVVGEISTLPVRTRFMPGAVRKFEESLTRFEESIDYLRTSILIARHQRSLQSLVVCSAASREGKSTVAAHLASSLARGIGGRVLLVDADMRRPHLHRLLDQEPDSGLVDYLAGRSEFADIVRSTWVERLDFVASGILDTPVGVLLASDRFERFLRLAEKQYEFIVIDVPPILPVSEGLVIAKAADGAIFCALRDVSTYSNVTRACDKLRSAGVHIVGAVFNGVPAREYGASGYYYYRIPQPATIEDDVQA